MSQSSFEKRLERIQDKKPATKVVDASHVAKPTQTTTTLTMGRALLGILCGGLGIISGTAFAFANENYDRLKADYATDPEFVTIVFAVTGLSVLLFIIFAVWGVIALIAFKKGKTRNIAVLGFFIGMAIASLAGN